MRRRRFIITALSLALAACGARQRTPALSDPVLDELFARLAEATSANDAAPTEQAIWARWADSGSPTVDVLLERAAAAESDGDAELAIGFLDQASALAPAYAEPWSRRATLAYRAQDFSGAVAAIQETLKREPRHFAAMTWLGQIYEELGQERRALEAYRGALSVHPHYEAALEGVRRLELRVDGRDA